MLGKGVQISQHEDPVLVVHSLLEELFGLDELSLLPSPSFPSTGGTTTGGSLPFGGVSVPPGPGGFPSSWGGFP